MQQYLRQIHSLFAEQTQTGHHLLSIQPGLTSEICQVAKMAFTFLCLDCYVQLCQLS